MYVHTDVYANLSGSTHEADIGIFRPINFQLK